MKHLWSAVRNRWKASRPMVLAGGPLYRKLGAVKPCTVLTTRLIERLDTFTEDIEKWELKFRFMSGETSRPDSADEWLEVITATFKDANVLIPAFYCCSCVMINNDGPDETDGSFDCEATFEVVMQRKTLLPVVRVA